MKKGGPVSLFDRVLTAAVRVVERLSPGPSPSDALPQRASQRCGRLSLAVDSTTFVCGQVLDHEGVCPRSRHFEDCTHFVFRHGKCRCSCERCDHG